MDPEVTEPMQDEEAAGARTDNGSLLSRIRERRAQLQEERHLDLDIPGYDGMLVARYRPLPWDEVKKIGEKVEKSKNPRKELYAMADVLVRACDSIWFRDPETNELRPVQSGEPVRYDDRLAEALGFTADSARQVLLATFNNDLAVTAHHMEAAEWMQASDVEVNEDLLGE